jgi:hypothetical protein
VTLEGPLAGVLRRAAYLYRQPTDQACALCFMHLPSPFTLPASECPAYLDDFEQPLL